MNRSILPVAAAAEAATGIALLIAPELVARLLLGVDLAGGALHVARVLGIALVALAVACWPGIPLLGMLTYSLIVTLYLAFVGLTGEGGTLLWPAVLVHAILSALLARQIAPVRGISP